MVETYRSRGGSSVVLQAPRRPSSIASALGDGLSQLGQAGLRIAEDRRQADEAVAESEHRVALEEQRRRRAAEVATGAGRWADTGLAIERRLAELPERGKPGAQGYGAAATAAIDEELASFAASLPDDPEVRQHFGATVATTRAKLVGNVEEYERTEFAKYQGDAFDKFVNAEGNSLASDPSAENLAAKLAARDALLAGFKDMDGTTVERLRQASSTSYAMRFFDGLFNNGQWQAAREVLNSGQFDTVLPGKVKESYLNQAGVAEQAAAKQAELANAEAQKAARERLKQLEALQDGANEVPRSDWEAAIAAGRAAGLPESELIEWGNKGSDGLLDKQIRGLSTEVLDGEVDRLAAKRDAGQLKPAEARWLDRAEKDLKDRGGEAGTKLAPLLKGDAESRAQGLAALHAMPLRERWRAAEAAGDPKAAILSAIPSPLIRAQAVQGAERRKARGADYLPPKDDEIADPAKAADEVFRAVLGPGLVADSGGAYAQLREAALDLMAGNNERWNPRDFGRAVQVIYGMTTRGDGTPQGGIMAIEGRMVELPPKWTQQEFATRYARDAFDEGAVDSDGRPARAADIRKHFRLQYQGEDEQGQSLYLPIGPDGKPLYGKNRDGSLSPYIFPVPARPR